MGQVCSLDGAFGYLLSKGGPGNATTVFGVPGGGQYTLAYQLYNHGGPPNLWRAIVESPDGYFPAIVLESLSDVASFSSTARQLPFSVPAGTTAVKLTFEARHVNPTPSFHPPPGLLQLALSTRFSNE